MTETRSVAPLNEFEVFVESYPQQDQSILRLNKTNILKYLSVDRKSSNDLARFNEQLFVSHDFPCLIEGGDNFESDCTDEKELVHRAARNLLRHITRGALVKSGKEINYAASLALVENALDKKLNPALLAALRDEMKAVFKNCTKHLMPSESKDPIINKHTDKLFQIVINQLLSIYPFLNPEDNSIITIPQKISQQWINVEYQFKKLDISPKTGLLARLLEKQDKIYAYGLTPCQNQPEGADSHLLFMGTTYPTGQGAALAQLYNHKPTYSVGEGHNMTEVEAWITEQKHFITATGHSKGAVMAMMAAAKYPKKIRQANCLNPTGLRQSTLDRLKKTWPENQRPEINVFAQGGDPAYPLDSGFLEGTHIYRVFSDTEQSSNMKWFIPRFFQKALESHLHHFAARRNVLMIKIDPEIENKDWKREWWTNLKLAVDVVYFPVKYSHLCMQLCARKAARFYDQHRNLINGLTIAGMMVLGALLACTVFLAPISSLFVADTLSRAGLLGAATGLFTSLIFKPVCRLAINISEFILVDVVPNTLLAGLLLVTGFTTGIKMGLERLFCRSLNSDVKPSGLSSQAKIFKVKSPIYSPLSSKDTSFTDIRDVLEGGGSASASPQTCHPERSEGSLSLSRALRSG